MKSSLNKKIIQIFFIAVIISFGSFYIYFNTKKSPPERAINQSVIYPVSLLENRAEPDIVIIKFGDYVQFNSKDGKEHKIGYGSGDDYGKNHEHFAGAPEAVLIQPDEGYRIHFRKVGTFYLHDHLNPKIFTTVVVYDPSK